MKQGTVLHSRPDDRFENRNSQYTSSGKALWKRLLPAALLVIGATLATGVAGEERLEMDGMAIIGNRELPKALFIVPWKDPETALAPDRPINTLIDEALQPVDPEVFRRKLQYYDIVHRKD